jgi:hypothetical protein
MLHDIFKGALWFLIGFTAVALIKNGYVVL